MAAAAEERLTVQRSHAAPTSGSLSNIIHPAEMSTRDKDKFHQHSVSPTRRISWYVFEHTQLETYTEKAAA